jgi:hypothetical protein
MLGGAVGRHGKRQAKISLWSCSFADAIYIGDGVGVYDHGHFGSVTPEISAARPSANFLARAKKGLVIGVMRTRCANVEFFAF